MERDFSQHGDPVYTPDEITAMIAKTRACLSAKAANCLPAYRDYFTDRLRQLDIDAQHHRPAADERIAMSCVEWGPDELQQADRVLRDQYRNIPRNRRFP